MMYTNEQCNWCKKRKACKRAQRGRYKHPCSVYIADPKLTEDPYERIYKDEGEVKNNG